MNTNETMYMIIAACDAIIANEDYLTEVDQKIGDGDHGSGMSLGMKKVKEALLSKAPFDSVNDMFKTTGMTMLNSMGGASGVIFGTMFLGGIKGKSCITELDGKRFLDIMQDSLNAIKERDRKTHGKETSVGDKTMIDALEPAVLAMAEKDSSNIAEMMSVAAAAAAQGVENTKNQIAKFGRARYLGVRVIGYQDAGATSVSIIFQAMSDYLMHHNNHILIAQDGRGF